MTATDELCKLLEEHGIKHFDYDKGGRTQTQWAAPDGTRHFTYETYNNPSKTAKLVISWFPTPEQAIAATLGTPISADLRTALDFMRIWLSEDAHLGESAISYEFEKAEGLRKLDAIEQAIAATLGNGECTPHGEWESISQTQEVRHVFCDCGYELGMDERDSWPFKSTRLFAMPNFCQECGRKIRKAVKR